MALTRSTIAARRAQLKQQNALAYKPSLSAIVDDALFSYWRLPRPAKQTIAAQVPSVQVDCIATTLHVTVDWDAFSACLQPADEAASEIRGVHIAWALALHAETAFDVQILPKLLDSRLATDDTSVHHAVLRPLLRQLHPSHGDYYMTFVVLITVLEKALYDLYYQHEDAATSGAGCDSEPVSNPPTKKLKPTTTTIPPSAKKKNMILRDLLRSDVLQTVLPQGLMELFRILFLPSGLNLRNLVWHGFLIPAQLPRCVACLTATLLLELPRFAIMETRSASTMVPQLFQLQSFDDRFLVPKELLAEPFSTFHEIQIISKNSPFVPHGRERLVHRALRRLLTHGDELYFLMALLPVLEHALRLQFVAVNALKHDLPGLHDFKVAQIDQYYSTLDGFGQRDKHQVLLHPDVAYDTTRSTCGESSRQLTNALYETVPPGPLAVCLDLFMMAAGPNVRAKLCHGEADLSTLLRLAKPESHGVPELHRGVSTITKLVLLTWLSLCYHWRDTRTDPHSPSQQPEFLKRFTETVGSSFHPYYQLQRKAESCTDRLLQFESLSAQWSHVRLTAVSSDTGESLTRLEFLDETDTVALQLIDKTQRMLDIQRLLCPTDTESLLLLPKAKKPTGFGDLVSLLRTKTTDALAQLTHHNTNCKSNGEDRHRSHQYARSLLALSDADGLSVSACMLDVLASIERSLASLASRVAAFSELIRLGTARTSQRRSFLNNVALLPVFHALQKLVLGLVAHQLTHLESRARWRLQQQQQQDECGATAPLNGLCLKAVQFEHLQRKLLQFITAFEGCTGSDEGATKSAEKALQLALQFLDSKPLRVAIFSSGINSSDMK